MISPYFQDHMEGNVCFGCGKKNDDGLHIKGYWEGDEAHCIWQPEEKYHGWANLLSGGILSTIIDCHCMGTAMAYAYKSEGRALDSKPWYRYATGTMNIKFLRPTPIAVPVKLIARVTEQKGKKVVMKCEAWSGDTLTAEADVIAIRVYNSADAQGENPFID
ncbi:PaaI family thioesterase [Flammeovirga sp. EKP202]|uniref:PaaI family thioesterase n=1 Tax=Flammeovirga sp. EKP202 TaxID=2770592 RepID=UPI00165F79D1|nr:PaaI family thioesterase [Flammeovirga sp. EKP202]MBD0404616.1 PaaI family thioesterase [Flammeovirga sp. EKP202]